MFKLGLENSSDLRLFQSTKFYKFRDLGQLFELFAEGRKKYLCHKREGDRKIMFI